jgi:hypothetical protein
LIPVTNEENAAAETLSTGPPGFFESRTGTLPVADTTHGAHSTQEPPLLL